MGVQVELLITEHLDLWTQAQTAKSTSGRGSNNKIELTGIKKLRELILELAVRGKLVSQDPNDEPASELLKRIATEKETLFKAGKLKKQKPLPPISDEEKPFELPMGWEWARLGYAATYGSSLKSETNDADKNTWVLELEDIEKDTSRLIQKVRFSEREFKSTKSQFNTGDVLYGKLRPYLDKVIVADEPGVCTTEIIPINCYGNFSPYYLRWMLKTPRFIKYADESTHGMNMPRLGTDKGEMALVAVAPVSEQSRIVAKIDELMALCDQLEQQSYHQLDAHNQLVDALLATLPQSQNADELASNWQRLAAHFDTLFTTEYSIDALKQTILQLAVMGKLVKQDPNDEPASELLKRIAAEKDALVKAGKIKKQKPLPPISADEKPFELPEGWEWVKLGDIYPEFQNGASSRGDTNGRDIVVLRLADISNLKISEADTRTLQIAESSLDKYILGAGDILIVRVNGSADLVGRFIHCDKDYDAIYCDHFIRMRFSVSAFVTEFLVKISNSLLVREAIQSLFVSTAGQKTVNQTHISSLLVPVPPLKEQLRIVNKLKVLDQLAECLSAKLSSLKQIQALLAETLVDQVVV
ncbi:restriction endonuclease subunit S [Alishewanella longhuensis]